MPSILILSCPRYFFPTPPGPPTSLPLDFLSYLYHHYQHHYYYPQSPIVSWMWGSALGHGTDLRITSPWESDHLFLSSLQLPTVGRISSLAWTQNTQSQEVIWPCVSNCKRKKRIVDLRRSPNKWFCVWTYLTNSTSWQGTRTPQTSEGSRESSWSVVGVSK